MPTPITPCFVFHACEASVAGAKVIFLLIAGTVRNVALSIDAQDFAIGISHRHAVEIVRSVLLEERNRNDDAELFRQLRKRQHARMFRGGIGRLEPFQVLARAEIDTLKQLGGQNDLRAPVCSLADEGLGFRDVGCHVPSIGGLDGGDCQRGLCHQAGSCWVMQWNDPPPASPQPRRPVEGTPMTSRSGNTVCKASMAATSVPVP